MHMYIKDKYRFFFFLFFFFFFFAKFTFSAIMRHVDFFSNITYKEGRFYQKRSELDFRCESGRKGEKKDTLTGIIYR